MNDWIELLKVVVPVVVTAVSGGVAAVWKLVSINNNRMQVLISRVEALDPPASQVAELKKGLDRLREDVTHIEKVIQESQAVAPSKKYYTETQNRLQTLENRVDLLLGGMDKQAKELSAFVKAQNVSWQQVNRVFGRLEERLHWNIGQLGQNGHD